jgi:hypothetical protein
MADLSPRVKEILERRATAYRSLVQASGWGDVLQSMLAYANQEKDPAVRCGRLDMVAHMIRAADTAGNMSSTEIANGA